MADDDRSDYRKRLFVAALFLGVLYWGLSGPSPSSPTPPPLSAEAQARKDADDARWTEAVLVARTIRESMKNPRSFELVQALRMESGALCFTYRATNSFNAIVPGFAVYVGGKVHASGSDGFQRRWDRHCGGKSGEEIRGLAYAL